MLKKLYSESVLKKQGFIKVKPRKTVLTDAGTTWEYTLRLKGWNKLKKSDRYGFIIKIFKNDLVDVYWPKINFVSESIFLDEIRSIKDVQSN